MSVPEEAVEAVWSAVDADSVTASNIRPYIDDTDLAIILEAAAPIIRAEERKRIIAAIQDSTIGAPLYLEADGTAHIASGPEMREILCAFIEGSES